MKESVQSMILLLASPSYHDAKLAASAFLKGWKQYRLVQINLATIHVIDLVILRSFLLFEMLVSSMYSDRIRNG